MSPLPEEFETVLFHVESRSMGREDSVAVEFLRALVTLVPRGQVEQILRQLIQQILPRYQQHPEYAPWAESVLGGKMEYSPLARGLAIPGGNEFISAVDRLVSAHTEDRSQYRRHLVEGILSVVCSRMLYAYGRKHPALWRTDFYLGEEVTTRINQGLPSSNLDLSQELPDDWNRDPVVQSVELESWRQLLELLMLERTLLRKSANI